MPFSIAEYLQTLKKNLARGDATEHTHRPALKSLIESFATAIVATNEPKRIACGAPDFSVSRKSVPLGHIETKDVGTDLTEIEQGRGPHGQQFKRYSEALPSWILTDYLTFYWYVDGERRLTAELGSLDGKGRIKELPEGGEKLSQLIHAFLTAGVPTVESARELARRMAGMTRILRGLIAETFKHGSLNDRKQLENLIAAFRETLIPDLSEGDFADMFAQTLAYGLFAARVHSLDKPFNREAAAFSLPKTNPFLRKLFSEIAGVDMPDTFGWAVDDLVELLRHTQWAEVLKDFGKGKAKHDPVVHFYETFLAAYDPKTREVRGVYYTPEPVVSYIVRSVERLLKTEFKKSKGLADENTLILDPAVGTATFLFFVVQQIFARFAKQAGIWDGYVSEHLLDRVFGFELLMAPYAVAHLKLGMELQQTGYRFHSDQRLGIYLTNTLEEAAKKSEKLFAQWISDEANAAVAIKRDLPILVVLGNPPYSGHSANRSRDDDGNLTFIGKLIEDYKVVDGQPLGERNPKWLQDDYVKFIRFAQWRIERTGHGVLGFITNHGYLDNPTFRGMRQSLMQSFTDIHVYDLHGNTKKKERPPDGSKDENVFDIQQGVAILLALKNPEHSGLGRVHHADLWGLRTHKYAVLGENEVSTTKWQELKPKSPTYLFIPQTSNLEAEFHEGNVVTEAFSLYSLAMNTHRDDFTIAFDRDTLIQRIESFLDPKKSDAQCYEEFGLEDNPDFTVANARAALRADEEWRDKVIQCLYRPFDVRWCLFSEAVIDRPRPLLNEQMLKGNISLITTRQNREPFFVLATDMVCGQHKIVARYDGSYVFPLWRYPKQEGFAFHGDRQPNLSGTFRDEVRKKLGRSAGPDELFCYIYAVLSAPMYRQHYSEFLSREFPRVLITSDRKLFESLAVKGEELLSIHLMHGSLDEFITEFPVKGQNEITNPNYEPKGAKVWINAGQYFGGVPQDVWDFHVGGYQVCKRWLQDRRGRKLTYDDVQHWQRIVIVVRETMRVLDEIDSIIPNLPLT